MSTSRQPRAALYARVSTADQDTALQLDELRHVAEQRDWRVVAEHVDHGVSGAESRRPELDRLMASVRTGKFDVAAVWRFDRFARSTRHLLEALEEFRLLGVDFVSIREGIDTATPVGKMVFTFIGAVAEFERELLRERVKAGMAAAKAKGKHCGRPVVEIDLRPAVALLKEGRPLGEVASILGVARTTLRRRLRENGLWDPPGGVHKGPEGEAA